MSCRGDPPRLQFLSDGWHSAAWQPAKASASSGLMRGLNMALFSRDVVDLALAAAVRADKQSGKRLGVPGPRRSLGRARDE
jgi:hypothetical protein